MSLILRGYWRSSCSWRVRIVLGLKDLAYESVPVHLVQEGGQQFQEEHSSLNPEELVPVLIDGDVVLSQSVAICEYLEEKHPDPRLLPEEPSARAHVRQMVELVNSSIQPIQNLRVMLRLKKKHGFDDRMAQGWNRHWIERGFHALERHIETHGGICSFGDSPTLADAFLVPQVYNAIRFGVDLEAFPRLLAVHDRVGMHPAFDAARPGNQVDAPSIG